MALSPALSQGTPADWQFEFDRWPISRGPLFSLIHGDDHYVINARGEQELYDVEADPWATSDLADRAGSAAIMSALRGRITDLLGRDPTGGGR